jgi:hypothetical protein
MIIGEFGDIIPAVVGGGSTAYWCDYHYTYVLNTVLRGVLFGAAANYGAHAGFGYAYSDIVPSTASADVGSRLCFIPAGT